MNFFKTFVSILVLLVIGNYSFSQNPETNKDSLNQVKNSVVDTNRLSKQAIEKKIVYSAKDSIKILAQDKRIFLYGDSKIEYDQITLTASKIEIDFESKILTANYTLDTANNIVGKPYFKEGEKWFEASSIKYNYDTKQGYLTDIFSEESEAYLHGKQVKRLSDEVILVKDGSFTTCSEKHPHFDIKFTKAKIIPDSKIITGPVWLSVSDVPMPLALPFGYFPNSKKQQSGIIIPSYGERTNMGFFLENGGYYFGISDYVDLSIQGDVYSRGSWATKLSSNYKKRYKYEGNLKINYAFNKLGEPHTENYIEQTDYFIVWRHIQDRKAHPRHSFNADVNAGSSDYSKFNPTTAHDYLSTNFSSSINFNTTIGNNINFSASIRHNQNKQTRAVSMNIPEIAMSTNRIYPFRRKKFSGKLRWYENININYLLNARNTLNTTDSLLFRSWQWKQFSNGIRHQIPVTWNQKLLKYFTLSNSLSYTERWYFETIKMYWDAEKNAPVTDTIRGFKSSRDFYLSSQLNTKLYGFFYFKKGYINAIRHMLTPSLSFTYRPDFSRYKWGGYKSYLPDGATEPIVYSIFKNGIYGYAPSGESGQFNINLSNNIEVKVKSKKDTINGGFKKITLIENLNAGMSYDVARDSLNWSKLMINARTRLWENFEIRYLALLDPYIIDSTGNNLNKFEWDVNKRLFRLNRTEWATSLNWTLGYKTKTAAKEKDKNTSNDDLIPWNISFAYTLQYTKNYNSPSPALNKMQIIQTLSFNGDIKLTPNWKIGFMSGYDFTNKNFSYTSVNIYRDLHCWEIVFNWVPWGFRQSYNFTLRAKAPMLQDLKIEKKTDFRDFY